MSNSGTNLQFCGRSRPTRTRSPQLTPAIPQPAARSSPARTKKAPRCGAPFGVGVSCSGYSSSPSSSHSLSLALAMLEAADS